MGENCHPSPKNDILGKHLVKESREGKIILTFFWELCRAWYRIVLPVDTSALTDPAEVTQAKNFSKVKSLDLQRENISE